MNSPDLTSTKTTPLPMPPADPTIQLTATVHDLEAIRQFLDQQSARAQMSEDAAYDLLLAVTELATNSLLHGYRGQPGFLELSFGEQKDSVVVHLRDHAPRFDPTQAPEPDLTIPLEKRRLGGLGIYLTRAMVDEMTFRPLPEGGNEITLVLRKTGRTKADNPAVR